MEVTAILACGAVGITDSLTIANLSVTLDNLALDKTQFLGYDVVD
jgi:hypothetical protein